MEHNLVRVGRVPGGAPGRVPGGAPGHAAGRALRHVPGGASSATQARHASRAWSWMVAFVCLCVSAVLAAGVGAPSARALDHGGLSAPGSVTVHRLLTSKGQELGAGDGLVSEEIKKLNDATPAVGEKFSLYRLDTPRVEGAVSGVEALTGSVLNEAITTDDGTGANEAILKLIEQYAGQSADSALVSSAATDANGEVRFTDLPFAYYVLVSDPDTAQGSSPAAPCIITLPYAGENGSFVKDVHVYPKTGRSTRISKSVASPKKVVGVSDEVVWNVDFPVPSELKKTINGQVSYGSNWSVYDDVDSRLDLKGVAGANAGQGTAWTMRVTDTQGNASTLQPAAGDTDVKATWDAASRRITWWFSDDFARRVCDEATAVNIRVVLTTTVNASAMNSITTMFNDAVISFTNASGDPFVHRVIDCPTTARAADGDGSCVSAGDENDSSHPRVYIGAISVSKRLQGTDTPLQGARFALATSEEDAKAGRFLTRDGAVFERESDAQGALTFEAVGAGDYWLVETQAPQCPVKDGGKVECAKLAQPVKVTVGNSKAGSHPQVQVDNHAKTVIDEIIDKGSSVVDKLAKTGLSVGALLAAAALALALALAARRRRRAATPAAAPRDSSTSAAPPLGMTMNGASLGMTMNGDPSSVISTEAAPSSVISTEAAPSSVISTERSERRNLVPKDSSTSAAPPLGMTKTGAPLGMTMNGDPSPVISTEAAPSSVISTERSERRNLVPKDSSAPAAPSLGMTKTGAPLGMTMTAPPPVASGDGSPVSCHSERSGSGVEESSRERQTMRESREEAMRGAERP